MNGVSTNTREGEKRWARSARKRSSIATTAVASNDDARPVVTDAAAHKVRALLGNLKSAGIHALRTTFLLCCLALHGPKAAAQSAGIAQVQEANHTALPIGRADAERLFSLAPI